MIKTQSKVLIPQTLQLKAKIKLVFNPSGFQKTQSDLQKVQCHFWL